MNNKATQIKAIFAILIFIAPLFIQLGHSQIHTHTCCHVNHNADGFKIHHDESTCLINSYELSTVNFMKLVRANFEINTYYFVYSQNKEQFENFDIPLYKRLRAPPRYLHFIPF